MKAIQLILSVLILLCISLAGHLEAQDYTTQTLSFEDITSVSINQTVNESSGNEKAIDFGDYDNDGDTDVVVAAAIGAFGQRRNKLYRNDNGVLNEVSGSPVIAGFNPTDVSRCAFFRDFDHDGLLDIIIVNDGNAGESTNDSPGKTKYFRNVDGTTFVNESGRLSGQSGAACNGTAADFDNNGYCDLLMCNYPFTSQDSLGLNNINAAGAGQFTVVTGTHFPSESNYGVNSEAADMNGDGQLDVLTANLGGTAEFIYYNNNSNAGSGIGDFKYNGAGASTTLPNSGTGGYQTLMPCDFNNDGMMDFYYTNSGSSFADVLYINTGNDANNKALFTTQQMPSSVNGESNKVSCPDLDADGRADIVVMSELRRPFIFRNTSENGETSFIEWTPAIFTTTHEGWHAHGSDLTGNGRQDLFVGAYNDDFLFQNVDSELTDEDSLGGGVLPTFHNSAPIAVSGTLAGGGTTTFTASGIPSGASVSILLRSGDDLSLAVSGSNNASSTRSGEHVDEAIQFIKSGGGDFTITIDNESDVQLLGDANHDGMVSLLDVGVFIQLIETGGFDAIVDMNSDGALNLLDVNGFVTALSKGGAGELETPFVIEYLSRSN